MYLIYKYIKNCFTVKKVINTIGTIITFFLLTTFYQCDCKVSKHFEYVPLHSWFPYLKGETICFLSYDDSLKFIVNDSTSEDGFYHGDPDCGEVWESQKKKISATSIQNSLKIFLEIYYCSFSLFSVCP